MSVPVKSSRMAEALCLGDEGPDAAQLSLAFAQVLLGPFPVVDIDENDIPAFDWCIVRSQRNAHRTEPAIITLRAAQTMFDLIGNARCDGAFEDFGGGPQVVRVHEIARCPFPELSKGLSEVSKDLRVGFLDLACRCQNEDERRNILQNQASALREPPLFTQQARSLQTSRALARRRIEHEPLDVVGEVGATAAHNEMAGLSRGPQWQSHER